MLVRVLVRVVVRMGVRVGVGWRGSARAARGHHLCVDDVDALLFFRHLLLDVLEGKDGRVLEGDRAEEGDEQRKLRGRGEVVVDQVVER